MLATTTDIAHALDAPARAVLAGDEERTGTPEPDRRRRPGRRARTARPRRDTRFRPGNRAWTARRSPGRRRRFAGPDALEAACIGYLEWSDAHPLIHLEPVTYRGEVTMLLEVPRLRPYTVAGLCAHLSIGAQTWRDYRRRPAFSWVCGWVDGAIRAQQFEGAAAGLFDARIIARALGLGLVD